MVKQVKDESKLVLDNLGLVLVHVKNFKPNRVTDFDDYKQVGMLALLKAIRAYKSSKGKLSSFAWPAIFREISKEARKFRDHNPNVMIDVPEETPPSKIEEYLPDLTEEQMTIIMMRSFGYTLNEIGEHLDKTREWVRQQISKMAKRIQEANDK